jgi:hypothetical protein
MGFLQEEHGSILVEVIGLDKSYFAGRRGV